jgi:leucine dehydrogenase
MVIAPTETEKMTIFKSLAKRDHEQVTFLHDEATGLKAIIAVHDTTLGPSLGGCRMWNYATEEEALIDVLRLSRAMTYKASIAGLNLGGGKAVIIGDYKTDKSEMLFRAFGRYVEGLAGRYITAEDVGTSIEDMENVRQETSFVTGLSRALGGCGDPSPVTARGCFHGIQACVLHRFNKTSISGMKVAIQGLGHVGMHLTKLLYHAGVEIYASDIEESRTNRAAKEYGVTIVPSDEIYSAPVDIFAPCALGAIINDQTIDQLKCEIVAGACNNQLEKNEYHGEELMKRGILYAPDYVINSGGLINAANEYEGYPQQRAFERAEGIFDTLLQIFRVAEKENISPNKASDFLAEERIRQAVQLKTIYKPRIWGREFFAKSRQPARS